MPTQTHNGHMPHMVGWYRKVLLSIGMEMGRLPKACSTTPRKAPKRPRVEYDHLHDDEDSDDACFDSLVLQRYLRPLQPKLETCPIMRCHVSKWSSDLELMPGLCLAAALARPMFGHVPITSLARL